MWYRYWGQVSLASIENVRNIVFNASYLVMGLGDVYLGAPVATPVDPRHRLVTTKYNPARTWTPENAVGIGAAYLCIYGMEGPGGYQFVGRTLQMWNRYRQTETFRDDRRWLLNFFDQIRFYPVSNQELSRIREDFPLGRYPIQVEHGLFNLADYNRFLENNAETIKTFKDTQDNAFRTERQHWEEQGLTVFSSESAMTSEIEAVAMYMDNEQPLSSHLPGSIWKILIAPGDSLEAGQTVLIIESIKMEFQVYATQAGQVARILCREGDQVRQGQDLVVIQSQT